MRLGRSLFAAVASALSMLAIVAPAAAGAPSANECVDVRSAELSTGLTFDMKNACEKQLSCALSWTLTCENASGKATSKTKQEARFTIAEHDTHQTTGSSATCKDAWKIDDVEWTCASSSQK